MFSFFLSMLCQCFAKHTSFDVRLWGTGSYLLPLAAAGFESVYPGHLGGFHLSDITATWFPYDFTQWLGTVKATTLKKNLRYFGNITATDYEAVDFLSVTIWGNCCLVTPGNVWNPKLTNINTHENET